MLLSFEDVIRPRMLMIPFVCNFTEEEDAQRYKGKWNIFIMNGKKTVKRVEQVFDANQFLRKDRMFSIYDIFNALEK